MVVAANSSENAAPPFSVKLSEKRREIVARRGDEESVYAQPPRTVYWVTGVISNVSIVFDVASAAQENDEVFVEFAENVQCGDSNRPFVKKGVIVFDSTSHYGPGYLAWPFVKGQRISVGFTPDGNLFDILWPIAELKAKAGGTGKP